MSGETFKFKLQTRTSKAKFSTKIAESRALKTTTVRFYEEEIVRWLNLPAQVYSKKTDVPKWWKSAAVGAEANDM